MYCELCDKPAPGRCSACKTVYYCSPACQNADWKTHKKACQMQQKIDEIMNKAEAKSAAQPPKKPAKDRCTGCNVRFEEDEYECDQECPDCGYMTCESCSCHNSRGTCYCPKSNFGYPYCERNPAYYHGDGRTGASYKGDRHPHIGDQYEEDAFEKEPRACGNCSTVTRMLKREYC